MNYKFIVFVLIALTVITFGGYAYENYYNGKNNPVVEIQKTYSLNLINQFLTKYPTDIISITNDSRTTIIECKNQIKCELIAMKMEAIVTRLCVDKNGAASLSFNDNGQAVINMTDTGGCV